MTERATVSDADMRGMWIVAGAIIAAAVVVTTVAVTVVHVGMGNPKPEGQLISVILAILSLGQMVPQWIVIQRKAAAAQSATSDPQSVTNLMSQFRGRLVIRYALVEGAVFMNVVAYFLEHNWWSLALIGGLVFVMLAMFPTRTKIEHWIETQQMLNQTEG